MSLIQLQTFDDVMIMFGIAFEISFPIANSPGANVIKQYHGKLP
jgi:hypothetical protein